MENKAKLRIDRDYIISDVDENCFSSFVEPVGRTIYNGLYEPGHPEADINGFRKDVLALTRPLQLALNRFPGGNYVSTYRWEDSIGPKELRPRRADPAWFAIESNLFGINEFADWSKLNGSQIMMTVNLATRGVLEAMDCVEYCNFPSGTTLSDLRISHGYRQPHQIKYWCLSNEVDGSWQIGQKAARDYGLLAREASKGMKGIDERIETVLAGSSAPILPTFPSFDAEALEIAYPEVDYLSIHHYLDNKENDLDNYLAKPLLTEQYLKDAASVLDFIKAKVRSKKTVYLSFDEFNTWHGVFSGARFKIPRWQQAPAMFEDLFNTGDALALGGMLLAVLRHSDRVRIACISELVNSIAHIRTRNGGPAWVLPPYHVYRMFSEHGRGRSLLPVTLETPRRDTSGFSSVPQVDAAATCTDSGLSVFLINRSQSQALPLEIAVGGFEDYRIDQHRILTASSATETNTESEPYRVVPALQNGTAFEDGTIKTVLQPLSWNVILLAKR